jgi:hypothetical protein
LKKTEYDINCLVFAAQSGKFSVQRLAYSV